MGYYLDLYFRDENQRYSTDELVKMFCEQGCEPMLLKENPEWVEVYYRNDDYNASMLIHFLDIDKYPEIKYFADVRLSWSTNYELFVNTVRSLMVLGNVFDFYVYDSMLKTEISLENLEQVAEKVAGVAHNIVRGLGKVT